MIKKVIFIEIDEKEIKQYHIHGTGDWDSFDSLMKFLEQRYNARLQNLDNGIFTRKAYFNIGNFAVILEHHDDIGNYFYSYDLDANALLENIAMELELRLQNVL